MLLFMLLLALVPLSAQIQSVTLLGSDCVNGLPVQYIQVEVDTAQVQVGDTLVAQSAFFGNVYVPIDNQKRELYRFQFATAPNQFVTFSVTLMRGPTGIAIFHLSQIYAQNCSAFSINKSSLEAKRRGNFIYLNWGGELEGECYEIYLDGEFEAITQEMGYSTSNPHCRLVEIREIDFDGRIISQAFAEIEPETPQIDLYRITQQGLMHADYLQANTLYAMLRQDKWHKIYVMP